jgi:hypothetical protein
MSSINSTCARTYCSISDEDLSDVFSIDASGLIPEHKEALTAYLDYAQGQVSIAAAQEIRNEARAKTSGRVQDRTGRAGDHRLTLLDTLGYFTGDLAAKVRENDGMLSYDQRDMLDLLRPFNDRLKADEKEKHLALTEDELKTLAGACLHAGGPTMKFSYGDRSWNIRVFRAFCILLQERKRAKLGEADAASMDPVDLSALTFESLRI